MVCRPHQAPMRKKTRSMVCSGQLELPLAHLRIHSHLPRQRGDIPQAIISGISIYPYAAQFAAQNHAERLCGQFARAPQSSRIPFAIERYTVGSGNDGHDPAGSKYRAGHPSVNSTGTASRHRGVGGGSRGPKGSSVEAGLHWPSGSRGRAGRRLGISVKWLENR